MAETVGNCPRCGAHHVTFDVRGAEFRYLRYSWQHWYEVFIVCRRCQMGTIGVFAQRDSKYGRSTIDNLLCNPGNIDSIIQREGTITLKDVADRASPGQLPVELDKIFKEATTCMTVECWNAAATMFRLCIDIATKPLLPEDTDNTINSHQRRNLGPRLEWLFANARISTELQSLSTCIREDGNDGAHRGSLTKEDAEDLYDFTFELLERMFTEPARLAAAERRRAERRRQTEG